MGYDRQLLEGKKIKKYNLVSKLGSGSFGTVYKAVNTKTDQILAIKALSKKQMKQIPKLQQLVKSQIEILQQIKNQNVITFTDSFSSGDNVFIVTQFCNGGDLEQYCKKHGQIPQNQAVSFLKQILNGFKGLHQINTMHRDFKLANVLLHRHTCKIADLGFAKKLKGECLTITQLGTDQTMAPEVHEGQKYGWGADIWSLGVVFYQMLYDRLPYRGVNDWEILKKIKTTIPKFDDVDLSDEASDFIKRCLVYDPKSRITWKQIYDHPLFYKSDITLTTGYLRCSQLNFKSHKKYYEKNEDQKRKTVNLDEENELGRTQNKEKDVFENAGDIKNADSSAENIRKHRQLLQREFSNYEETIINRRNDMMLGVTYVLPLEKEFSAISVKHSPGLYQICKQAYIGLKRLRQEVTESSNSKQGYRKLTYWKEFKELIIYKNLCNQLMEDEIFAESMAYSYRVDSGESDNVNGESQIQKISETVNAYRKELTPFLKKQSKKNKPKFIKMLRALKVIEENGQRDFIKFNKDFENINIEREEKKLVQNL